MKVSTASWMGLATCLLLAIGAKAQVSAYGFSAELGNWFPINGSGTPIGVPNLPPDFNYYNDNSFVQEGQQIVLGYSTIGNGWPIGFTFTFNGRAYDRVGISSEGWLAFGNSADGNNAVYVPYGSVAYTPLSSALPGNVDPAKRNRISALGTDIDLQGAGGLWPIQILRSGFAPNRLFTVEWNMATPTGGSFVSFQIRLHEGGGNPANQIVQVIYGNGVPATALQAQVGLGGDDPSDFNNRAVTAAPYDWLESTAGSTNDATCRTPSSATYLPQGLTFTWTPPGCVVNGITIADLTPGDDGLSATLSWLSTTGAQHYDYVVTTGGPDDPPIASGSGLTDTTAVLTGLPYGQDLFVYVGVDCGEGELNWGSGLAFSTRNVVQVACGQPAQSFSHCYGNLEETNWHYFSTTGDPLRLIIHAGTIFSNDVLTIHDGPTSQSPVLFSSNNGVIAGQVINSTGSSLTMKLVSDDVGSCASQDFIPPMEWEVGCVDCSPVFATFQVVGDCDAGQFSVDVNVFAMGSASTVIIGSNADGNTVEATSPGMYNIGPFANGTPVIVTAANPDNPYCSAVSLDLVNIPCPVVGCGPETHAHCYDNNEHGQWAYQSESGERIGIRFLEGTYASGDQLTIYDGLDPDMSIPLYTADNTGNLSGLTVITSANNADHAILLELYANNSSSCATGQTEPWSYIVACYDDCSNPEATFTTVRDCDAGTYMVAMEVTSLGSASSLDVQNDGGVDGMQVTATGTYQIGPFPINEPVRINMETGSALCFLSSGALVANCDDVGITEADAVRMHVYPNPGDGRFRLELPANAIGQATLQVHDLAGRAVHTEDLNITGEPLYCNLEALPTGRYTLVITTRGQRWFAPVAIAR